MRGLIGRRVEYVSVKKIWPEPDEMAQGVVLDTFATNNGYYAVVETKEGKFWTFPVQGLSVPKESK